MLSGADMIVRSMIDQGVKHIFGYPGGLGSRYHDALHEKSDIEHVLVRHEQAAVHMADGYARATGMLGSFWLLQVRGQPTPLQGSPLPTWIQCRWWFCLVKFPVP